LALVVQHEEPISARRVALAVSEVIRHGKAITLVLACLVLATR
jgi:hypothetical protein